MILYVFHLFLWRGGWNLNATYMISDQMVGGWVNHICGTVALMLLQLFSYASVVGCAVDGGDINGESIYPTLYLRHYLLPKIKKKKVRMYVLSNISMLNNDK